MYLFSQSQRDSFEALGAAGAWADMYDLIYTTLQSPDPFGNIAPANTVAWFGAAAQTNRGIGGASDLIRDYTRAQLEIRAGLSISNIDSVLQEASNDIARLVLQDILESTEPVDGVTYYRLPSAQRIGEVDALASLGAFAPFSTDPAVWSGNLLYLGLGIDEFWNENIINQPGNTYNLFASVASFSDAGLGALLGGNVVDLFRLFFGQGSPAVAEATSVASRARDATDVFLANTYGVHAPDGGVLALAGRAFVVGSESDDTGLRATTSFLGSSYTHGGAGDDVLIGTVGYNLIDGGTGYDTASFESETSSPDRPSLTASLYRVDSSAAFSAFVESAAGSIRSALFNVEALGLGLGDDTLEITNLSRTFTSLREVYAGEHGDFGDTIDLSGYDFGSSADERGATVSLHQNSVGILGDSFRLQVFDFENVIGTSRNDRIVGDDQANILIGGEGDDILRGRAGNDILIGGPGADELHGGAGDDWLFFDAEDTVVLGGGGRDVAVALGSDAVTLDLTEQSIEIAIGASGDDTFLNARRNHMVAGGDGDDYVSILLGTSGRTPTVLWGGEGADTFDFRTDLLGDSTRPVGILLLTVDDLTEQNFANFTRDLIDAQMPRGFRWTHIDAIILNADEDDRIQIDGIEQGVSTSTHNVVNFFGNEENPFQIEVVTSYEFLSAGAEPDQTSLIAGTYRAGFLARDAVDVFAAGAIPHEVSYFEYEDPVLREAMREFGPMWWDGIFSPDAADFIGSTDTTTPDGLPGNTYFHNTGYVLARPNGFGENPSGLVVQSTNPFGDDTFVFLGVQRTEDIGDFTVSEAIGPWFVYGGRFEETSITADDTFVFAMPSNDDSSQLDPWSLV